MRIVETYDIENFGKVAKVYAKLKDIVYLGRDGRYKLSCDRCCFNKLMNAHVTRQRFCSMCRSHIENIDIKYSDSRETIYFVRLTAINKKINYENTKA
jgi:hypothetical protein|nr:MAG TPA: hypothetical protein [Crassvirales sp.]